MTQRLLICVLGLHPSSRGFGWIVFEDRAAPFDWGTADVRGNKNIIALARITEIFIRYQPTVVAIETFDDQSSRRRPRIRALYREIVAEAGRQQISVRSYSRTDIRAVFPGSKTRHDVAAAVARHIPPLRPKLPKPRKIWETERGNMALFSAAACALTHYATSQQGP